MLQRPILAPWLLLLALSCARSQTPPDPSTELARNPRRSVVDVMRGLQELLRDQDGVFVTGPLNPSPHRQADLGRLLRGVRVVCADREAWLETVARFDPPGFDTLNWQNTRFRPSGPAAVSVGAETWLPYGFEKVPILICTIHQLRWLIWADAHGVDRGFEASGRVADYGLAVLAYLREVESGITSVAPTAQAFDLPDSLDFYRQPPDYVIQGYDHYKAFLESHASIGHLWAAGATEVAAGDSLVRVLKESAEVRLYPNKEAAALQIEFRKFFERGGTLRSLYSLSAGLFATLPAGEYFFGINRFGQLRFGRELLREEVTRIEAETGRKAPRANHAFLFPGEPLLSAGAFWVSRDSLAQLVRANAGSGHYFYSNIQPTIREDIAQGSDTYFLSLGHFFRALDSLGIPYDTVVISKF